MLLSIYLYIAAAKILDLKLAKYFKQAMVTYRPNTKQLNITWILCIRRKGCT